MRESLTLPFFCRTAHQSCLLQLNEKKNLCFSRSGTAGEWSKEVIILSNCRCFAAAAEAGGRVHVIAANEEYKPAYILISEDSVREMPFIFTDRMDYFLLSFSDGGGCFLGGDKQTGKLRIAKFNAASGWREERISLAGNYTVPAALASDKNGGIHLLLYDPSGGSLTYMRGYQGTDRWEDPFLLDSALQLLVLPVIWIDTDHNLHFVWCAPGSRTICYRMKKAGRWPYGGWQPEHYIPVSAPVRLISFFQQSEKINLWSISADNCVQIYSRQDGDWQSSVPDTKFNLPVRQGSIGGELYNLAGVLPTNSWFFPVVSVGAAGESITQKDDQEENLLVQIKKLMEEKRNLSLNLKKMEESLSQYRLMLELSHSNMNQQRSEWKAAAVKQEERLRSLEAQCKRFADENNIQKEQLAELKRQQSAAEKVIQEKQAELSSWQCKIAQAQIQEAHLSDTIVKLERDLKRKKGVWESISAVFHKKE